MLTVLIVGGVLYALVAGVASIFVNGIMAGMGWTGGSADLMALGLGILWPLAVPLFLLSLLAV
jgi:hypothetical protein